MHFEVAACYRLADSIDHSRNGSLDSWPARCSQDNDSDLPHFKVLLIPEIAIRRHENLEAFQFGYAKQCTIFKRGPALFVGCHYYTAALEMPGSEIANSPATHNDSVQEAHTTRNTCPVRAPSTLLA